MRTVKPTRRIPHGAWESVLGNALRIKGQNHYAVNLAWLFLPRYWSSTLVSDTSPYLPLRIQSHEAENFMLLFCIKSAPMSKISFPWSSMDWSNCTTFIAFFQIHEGKHAHLLTVNLWYSTFKTRIVGVFLVDH